MKAYLEMNGLLVLGYFLMRLAEWARTNRVRFVSASAITKIAYGTWLLALLLPPLVSLIPQRSFLTPSLQLWSAPNGGVRAEILNHSAPRTTELLTRWFSPGLSPLDFGWGRTISWLTLLLVVGFGLFHLVKITWSLRVLHKRLESLPVIRSIGRVRLVLGETGEVPFSVWMRGRAWVLLPPEILFDRSELLISVRHEIQHHRSRDTLWLYGAEVITALFYWNPVAHLWSRLLNQLQEFACDEALINRRKILPQAYARCLLRVAETAVVSPRPLAGTASMASGAHGLQRRIEMLFANRDLKSGRWFAAGIALFIGFLMTGAAYASKGLIRDRRIGIEEAKSLFTWRGSPEFPIPLNEAVLAELNRFVGTPEGRRFFRESLQRLPQVKTLINEKLEEYRLPEELMAVPLIESGFRNMNADSRHPSMASGERGAGIWMFLAQTARNYGLVVTPGHDDRLDVEKETDAAMRLLGALNLRFRNWGLALASYAQGDGHVQRAITATGERDPWKLMEQGKIDHYVAKIAAAILIMRNPPVLE